MVTIEERVSRLEGAFEQMSETLQTLGDRMTSLENRMTSLENRMTTMFVGMMGTMMVGFITLFVAIILKS